MVLCACLCPSGTPILVMKPTTLEALLEAELSVNSYQRRMWTCLALHKLSEL